MLVYKSKDEVVELFWDKKGKIFWDNCENYMLKGQNLDLVDDFMVLEWIQVVD